MTQRLIAGETVEDIARALREFELTSRTNGMVNIHASMEPEVALPLRRALLRIESELLRREADELEADGPAGQRTDAQRRADALSELARRFVDAMRVPSDGRRIA